MFGAHTGSNTGQLSFDHESSEPMKSKATKKQLALNTRIYQRFSPEYDYVLHQGECLKFLRTIPDNTFDLTITSPPYCIGKAYESTTNVEDFKETHRKVLPEILRVTKTGGSICWQIGYHVTSRVIVPLDYLIFDIVRELPELKLRNRLIWSFGHGLHENERFTGRHETILWFTKGDDYHFDLDSVRVPQKYPGKKFYKGPKKGLYSGNPLGKNPSDVWDIPNVNANHKEKTEHPCQFPVGLAQRLVKALCPAEGTVFDPFSGVGSTGAAAALSKRRFVGAELDSTYCKIARERISKAHAGTLPFREVDVPVMDPANAGSVAKRPSHFLWQDKKKEILNGDESQGIAI